MVWKHHCKEIRCKRSTSSLKDWPSTRSTTPGWVSKEVQHLSKEEGVNIRRMTLIWYYREKFTSYFRIWIAFISFSYLITLARTFSMMFNKSGKWGHPHLILDLQEKLSVFGGFFFNIEYAISCGLFICGLYCVERHNFFDKFNHERMLNFVKCFFHLLRWPCDFPPLFC